MGAPRGTVSTVAPAPRRHRRRLVVAAAVLAIASTAAAAWWWFQREGASAAEAATESSTATVSVAPYQVTVAGAGTLDASRSLSVVSETRGTVAEIAGAGTRVVLGDVLVLLEPEPLERAVTEAELTLESRRSSLSGLRADQQDAIADLDRSIEEAEDTLGAAIRTRGEAADDLALAETLLELGSESPEAVATAQDAYDDAVSAAVSAQATLDRLRESRELRVASYAESVRQAELSVASAEVDLDDARDDLEAATVRAPFDGVVSGTEVEVGEVVDDAGTLLSLIDDTRLTLTVEIDETEIAQVAEDQTAAVTLDALPDAALEGTVVSVAPVGRLESNIPVFDVDIALGNDDLTLRPGMTAEAEIVVLEVDAAATVPLSALVDPPGDAPSDARMVRVVADDGSVRPQPVTLIDSIGFEAVVAGDLADGATVLVTSGGTAAPTGDAAATQRGGAGGGIPGVGGGPPGGRPF
jgi:HlyD family secretion protein